MSSEPADIPITDKAQPRPAPRRNDYVVVARRYRPQVFDELIGQQHVAKALSNAIESGRVGHAYLFTGARGVGKTSTARILAKSLNCVDGPTPRPCNDCDICHRVSTGDDLDVLEIDGASNRGIDEMRELRQNVNIRPSRARFKIYIIDEVHMLTRESFNALLKTLEEPPEHVKFVFCTTEPQKVPATVLSRCQRFDFAVIGPAAIATRLRQVADAEGTQIDDDALALLARRAEGSMRDGQSLLEELIAFGGEHVRATDVHRLLGTADDERLLRLVGHIVTGEAAAALAILDRALSEGVEVGQLVEQLIGWFRDMMVAAVDAPDETLLFTPSEAREELKQAAARLGLETVLVAMQLLDHTISRLRYSTQGRVLAELALVRLCRLESLDDLPALIASLRHDAGQPSRGQASPRRTAPPDATGMSPRPSARAASQADADANPPREGTLALTPQTAERVWHAVLARVSGLVTDHASKSARIDVPDAARLVVTFPAKYISSKAFCERPDQIEKLRQALQEVTGTQPEVQFAVLDESAAAEPAVRDRKGTPQERLAEKLRHPMIQRANELFDARPIRFDEPEP